MKSYDIQNLKTKEWNVVSANSPKKAIEILIGRTVSKVREVEDALYYVYETGTQSDKYYMYTGRYGLVSLYK